MKTQIIKNRTYYESVSDSEPDKRETEIIREQRRAKKFTIIILILALLSIIVGIINLIQ
jgi:predicted nucleic acid-binding Zn ribbon protein